MTLRWVSVEQATGRIIADLPDLAAETLKMTMGRYETGTAQLPVPTAPDDWQRATLPGFAALIALDTADNGDDYPVWGGLVVKRARAAGGSPAVQLGLVTCEGYLDRRYVGDIAYSGVDQNAIAANLVDVHAGPGAAGLPFVLDWSPSATTRDRAYRDDDDRTVYVALTQLMGVIGGPEWTIGWRYLHGPERIVPVLHVRDRLGASPPPGLRPAAWFDMPGCVVDVQTVEDYSTGAGANDVVATGSSQGDTRPESPHQTAPADGRPRHEFRWSPSSSITDTDTLTAHAQRALAVLAQGSATVALTAASAAAPPLGTGWGLGDDIGYAVDHPSWPDGLGGIGRVIGWERTGDTVTPILAVPGISEGTDG